MEKPLEKSATDQLKYRVEVVRGCDCIILDEIGVEPTPFSAISLVQQSSSSTETAVSQPPLIKKRKNKKFASAKEVQII